MSAFFVRQSCLVCVLSLSVLAPHDALLADGEDSGFLFLQPPDTRRVKEFKNGNTLTAFHQTGSVVSDHDSSPWSKAACFAQGSVLKNGAEVIIAEVALCETIDSDGDLTWSTFWRLRDGSSNISIKAGTGKWEGIAGAGKLARDESKRIDGHTQPKYRIDWQIANLPPAAARNTPDDYAFHDEGLSFHGPHVYDFSKTLDSGVTLLVSSQSGVLLSNDKNARSPRNFATCYDRGTTYKPAPGTKGGGTGDAMLLEDTDPDGDIVWLYHEWWYNNPPGSYEFIGGTGKWKGITGYGVTRGMLHGRSDDHYMLKSEMHWNIAGN